MSLWQFLLFLSLSCSTLTHKATDADVTVEVESESPQPATQVKMFFPTEEWKTIEPDETVFAGLHYRINMATGLKEAKLMEGSNGTEYYRLLQKWLEDRYSGKSSNNGGFKISKQIKVPKKSVSEKSKAVNPELYQPSQNSLAIVPEKVRQEVEQELPTNREDVLHFMNDVKELDDNNFSTKKSDKDVAKEKINKSMNANTSHQFRSYEELKNELAELELLIDDEQSAVTKLIKEYTALNTVTDRLHNLRELKYLLHNVDNALVFIDHAGLRLVVAPSLEAVTAEERVQACRLVSACVQNFPHGQIAALEAGVLHMLLPQLQQDLVRSAAVSSIGSIARGFPAAQQQMVDVLLPDLLYSIDDDSFPSSPYVSKALVLVSDLLAERQHETGDRADQLAGVGLEAALQRLHWCSIVQRALTAVYQEHQSGATAAGEAELSGVLELVSQSAPLCRPQFSSSADQLRHIARVYERMMERATDRESAEEYRTMAEDCLRVLQQIL